MAYYDELYIKVRDELNEQISLLNETKNDKKEFDFSSFVEEFNKKNCWLQ